MHKGESVGQMIESFMVTPDKLEAMGLPPDSLPQGHWVGFHIPDPEVFGKVRTALLCLLAYRGMRSARRLPVATRLKKLRINRIDLVDKAAAPACQIALYKRQEPVSKRTTSMTTATIPPRRWSKS